MMEKISQKSQMIMYVRYVIMEKNIFISVIWNLK